MFGLTDMFALPGLTTGGTHPTGRGRSLLHPAEQDLTLVGKTMFQVNPEEFGHIGELLSGVRVHTDLGELLELTDLLGKCAVHTLVGLGGERTPGDEVDQGQDRGHEQGDPGHDDEPGRYPAPLGRFRHGFTHDDGGIEGGGSIGFMAPGATAGHVAEVLRGGVGVGRAVSGQLRSPRR